MPRVSIILPTYNRANFLKRSIESALSQTFQDFELVIIDDGSTDSTYEIFQNFNDSRIDLITTEHKGVSAARNLGLLEASGEFVTFLDSDDRFFPQKIELQLQEFFKTQHIGLVACGWREVTIQDHVKREARPWLNVPNLDLESWLLGCPVGTGVMMVKKELIDSIGGFDTNLFAHDDWDLGLRLSYYGCEMIWCRESLVESLIHDNNIHLNAAKSIPSQKYILDKFFSQPKLPDQIIQKKKKIYSKLHLRNALSYYKNSVWEEARKNLEEAINLDPILIINDYEILIKVFADWANSYGISNRGSFINSVYDHLPFFIKDIKKYRRKTLGTTEVQYLFKSRKAGIQPNNRLALIKIMVYSPYWLRNKGVLSLGIRALFNME